MRPASLIAVGVSAVLGVGLGIAGGLALDRGAGPFADPLGLGFPYRNQSCDGKSALLTVARGPGAPQLATAVADYPHHNLAYLDTSRSCRTAWLPADKPTPRYVAYLGPFGNRATACDTQFTAGRTGGVVAWLQDGTTDSVQCLCFVTLARPTLHTGMTADGADGIWLRQLQKLLVDMGLATDQDFTGFYDDTTAAKIREFQRGHNLSATGAVNEATWHSLMKRGCKLYDS